MLKDALMVGPIALLAAVPYGMLWVDEKLGVAKALASVSRWRKALHCSALTTIGLFAGLSMGYWLGIHP